MSSSSVLFAVFRLISLSLLFVLSSSVSLFAQWGPDQRLSFNDSISLFTPRNNASCIAAAGSVLHVVWFDYRHGFPNPEIYYKSSSDQGATWGPETRLSYDPGVSRYPSISASGTNVHVVWIDERDMGSNGEIYYKRSTDWGATWGPDTRLTYDSAYIWFPSVSASGTNVHVVYQSSKYAHNNNNYEICYKRSTEQGATWGPETRLTFDPGVSQYPSISAWESNVNILWEDTRSVLYGEVYYKRSTDWGTTWSQDTLFTNDPHRQGSRGPSVCVSESKVFAVWMDFREWNSSIYFKLSTDNGSTWSQDTRISPLPTCTWSMYPSVSASGGTNVHVVYQNRPDTTGEIIEYLRSSDSGTNWEPETRLTRGQTPFIALSDTMVHVVWVDVVRDGNAEIYHKRNPTGNLGVEENGEVRGRKLEVELKTLPNPFKTFATIPGHERERFALYDISGRMVGTYRGDRIGEGLSPGVYFLRSEGQAAKPLRLVKLR